MSLAQMLAHTRPVLIVVAAIGCFTVSRAQASDAPANAAIKLDRLSVVGSAAAAGEAGGSSAFLDREDLEVHDFSDLQRVLRQIPGVYPIDEEGFGLRPNIGIRGSGTDRSGRITLMEDGVLIAPAPYAAPSAYYFPTAARMSAVEVRKGSAAIVAGPRTTGGAVNLLSTPIPTVLSGQVDAAYGSDSTLLGHAWVGATRGRFGFLLETAQQSSDGFKRLDGGGGTGYTLEDYVAKLRFSSDPNADHYQEWELKLGSTGQHGDETYLGLTDADFAQTPYRRYAASARDNIVTDHQQVELRNRIELTSDIDLTTVIYRTEFARNWYKLDQAGGVGIAALLADPDAHVEPLGWLRGADSPDDALRLRNNNRSYFARGIQSVLAWRIVGERIEHALQAGLRFHEDAEDRLQDNDHYRMRDGELQLTTDGLPGSQDNRVGEAAAWSFYLQDELRVADWIITPGFRYESIDLTRTDYVKAPDGREQTPTRVRESSVSVFTPGIGATWLLSDSTNMFASVHRGFNPPGPGSSADPERSVNSEFGVRYQRDALSAELVGFNSDYRNLVGTCSASTGGNCDIGDQFDGGQATVRGIEAKLGFSVTTAGDLKLPLDLAYTYTDARFDRTFHSDFEEWMDVEQGDHLPYLPQHQLHLGAGIVGSGWRINLGVNYLDDMRTVAGHGTIPDNQRTDSAWVADLSAAWNLTDRVELYTRIENLTDETYVVARRPAGVRPGRDRAGFIGLRLNY